MSNTLYVPKNKNIDRRTKNIVHLSDGSIKYDLISIIAILKLFMLIILIAERTSN